MPNDLSQEGNFNIGLQNISESTINITQNILSKWDDYQDLREQLEMHEKHFALIPEDDLEERLKVSKKVNEFKDLIIQFKNYVLRFAEQFEKIEINSERIKQAKEFFDKGEIGEARAILEADLEQMNDEHLHFIRQREKFENEILPRLKNNSDEFYILALSKQTDYADADWFANTCTYFEKSIAAFPAKKNVFQYAVFLQNHNQFSKAESFYQKYLTDFSASIDLSDKLSVLINLGALHNDRNEYGDALKVYKEALEICRKLAEENPLTYSSYIAMTLNNLGNLHTDRNEYEDSLKAYEEALEICRKLAKENPLAYLTYVATTHNNLAYLHLKRNEYEDALKEYEEALKIRRKLAAENQSDLPKVAMTLNNLAYLHWNRKEYGDALKEYKEALEIRRKLATKNPSAYLPDVAMTLMNLGIFYQTAMKERETSINCLIEMIIIVLPIVKNVPNMQRYLQSAVACLQNWELSKEDIEKLIAQRLADEED